MNVFGIPAVRGMDDRDSVKCMRNIVRKQIDLKTTDLRRGHDIFANVTKAQNLRKVKPVISTRGGDSRNMVQEGRKKAQHNKANSPFNKYTIPFNQKIY